MILLIVFGIIAFSCGVIGIIIAVYANGLSDKNK